VGIKPERHAGIVAQPGGAVCSHLPRGQGRARVRVVLHQLAPGRARFHVRPERAGAEGGGEAWFKKCHFQVTPEVDRGPMVKGFLVLGVTLI